MVLTYARNIIQRPISYLFYFWLNLAVQLTAFGLGLVSYAFGVSPARFLQWPTKIQDYLKLKSSGKKEEEAQPQEQELVNKRRGKAQEKGKEQQRGQPQQLSSESKARSAPQKQEEKKVESKEDKSKAQPEKKQQEKKESSVEEKPKAQEKKQSEKKEKEVSVEKEEKSKAQVEKSEKKEEKTEEHHEVHHGKGQLNRGLAHRNLQYRPKEHHEQQQQQSSSSATVAATSTKTKEVQQQQPQQQSKQQQQQQAAPVQQVQQPLVIPGIEKMEKNQQQMNTELTRLTTQLNNQHRQSMIHSEQIIKELELELGSARDTIHMLQNRMLEAENRATAVTAQLISFQNQHENQPDLADEVAMEEKLAKILQDKLEHDKLAEKYRGQFEAQQTYFSEVISKLKSELEQEEHVILKQDKEKQFLEQEVSVAKRVIDSFKLKVQEGEDKAKQQLSEQHSKFMEQQKRVTDEFRAATEFCELLKSRLNSANKEINQYKSLENKLTLELQNSQKTVEELSAKLAKNEGFLEKSKHKYTLLEKKLKEEEVKYKGELSHLQELLVNATEKSRELEQVNIRQQKETVEQVHFHEEKLKIANKVIESLKSDVAAEAEKEREKYLEKEKELSEKLQTVRAQFEAAASLNGMLKSQLDEETSKNSQIIKERTKIQEDAMVARKEYEKIMELRRSEVNNYPKLQEEYSKLKKEFQEQHEYLISTEKRLEEQLMISDRERQVESEISQRLEEMSGLTKSLQQKLKDEQHHSKQLRTLSENLHKKAEEQSVAIKNLEADLREKTSELSEEKKKVLHFQNQLHDNITKEREVFQKRNEYIKELEEELRIAKELIDVLRQQNIDESSKSSQLLSEVSDRQHKDRGTIHDLQNTIDRLTSQLSGEASENRQLNLQNVQLNASVDAHKKLQQTIDELSAQNKDLKDRLSTLEEQLNASNVEIARHQKEHQVSKNVIGMLKSQLVSLESKTSTATVQVSATVTSTEELQAPISS